MAYQPTPKDQNLRESVTDARDPGLAIATKITTSQQSVLDQLHNHVAFTETLIFLSGPSGAGKTTILEVFLEQASDYADLAYTPDPAKNNANALRTKLLRQLVSLDAYSTDDSLLEALQRNIKPGRQHLVICIDNGHSLPSVILSELQELVSSRHLFSPEHRLSVVIAGENSWVKRASKGLALGNSEPPVVVEVPAFFKREQQWFARKLIATQRDSNEVVLAQVDALNENTINELLQQTQGYPGQIQAQLEEHLLVRPYTDKAMQARNRKLASQQQTDPDSARPRTKLSSNQLLGILIGFAALIAIAIALWLDNQEPSPAPTADETATFEAPTLPVEDSNLEQPVAENIEEPDVSAPVMEYEQAMQRLRERTESQPAPRDVQFQLVQPLNYLAQQADEPAGDEATVDDTDHAEDSNVEPADSPTESENASENLNPWAQAYDNLDLWQRNPNHYVFQVAAFNSEPRLQQFLAGFEHPEIAIYQTLREQQPWYMVVIGDFSSAQEATDYLTQNHDLQSIQPWLKRVQLIHEDLAPVLNDSAQDNN